jgi:hypothetical protein
MKPGKAQLSGQHESSKYSRFLDIPKDGTAPPHLLCHVHAPNHAYRMQVIKQSTLGLLLKSSGIEKNSDAQDVVTWMSRDSCCAMVPLSGWLVEKQEAADGAQPDPDAELGRDDKKPRS